MNRNHNSSNINSSNHKKENTEQLFLLPGPAPTTTSDTSMFYPSTRRSGQQRRCSASSSSSSVARRSNANANGGKKSTAKKTTGNGGGGGSLGVLPSFAVQLHKLLRDSEEQGRQHVISWILDGKAFRVHDRAALAALLPLYGFKQSKFDSFMRQLGHYGFKRIQNGNEKGGYHHVNFHRDHQEWLEYVKPTRRSSSFRKAQRLQKKNTISDLLCKLSSSSSKSNKAGVSVASSLKNSSSATNTTSTGTSPSTVEQVGSSEESSASSRLVMMMKQEEGPVKSPEMALVLTMDFAKSKASSSTTTTCKDNHDVAEPKKPGKKKMITTQTTKLKKGYVLQETNDTIVGSLTNTTTTKTTRSTRTSQKAQLAALQMSLDDLGKKKNTKTMASNGKGKKATIVKATRISSKSKKARGGPIKKKSNLLTTTDTTTTDDSNKQKDLEEATTDEAFTLKLPPPVVVPETPMPPLIEPTVRSVSYYEEDRLPTLSSSSATVVVNTTMTTTATTSAASMEEKDSDHTTSFMGFGFSPSSSTAEEEDQEEEQRSLSALDEDDEEDDLLLSSSVAGVDHDDHSLSGSGSDLDPEDFDDDDIEEDSLSAPIAFPFSEGFSLQETKSFDWSRPTSPLEPAQDVDDDIFAPTTSTTSLLGDEEIDQYSTTTGSPDQLQKITSGAMTCISSTSRLAEDEEEDPSKLLFENSTEGMAFLNRPIPVPPPLEKKAASVVVTPEKEGARPLGEVMMGVQSVAFPPLPDDAVTSNITTTPSTSNDPVAADTNNMMAMISNATSTISDSKLATVSTFVDASVSSAAQTEGKNPVGFDQGKSDLSLLSMMKHRYKKHGCKSNGCTSYQEALLKDLPSISGPSFGFGPTATGEGSTMEESDILSNTFAQLKQDGSFHSSSNDATPKPYTTMYPGQRMLASRSMSWDMCDVWGTEATAAAAATLINNDYPLSDFLLSSSSPPMAMGQRLGQEDVTEMMMMAQLQAHAMNQINLTAIQGNSALLMQPVMMVVDSPHSFTSNSDSTGAALVGVDVAPDIWMEDLTLADD